MAPRSPGVVTFGDAYEGPPGCVHGGFIAASFDEMLGFVAGATGKPGMTARLVGQLSVAHALAPAAALHR